MIRFGRFSAACLLAGVSASLPERDFEFATSSASASPSASSSSSSSYSLRATSDLALPASFAATASSSHGPSDPPSRSPSLSSSLFLPTASAAATPASAKTAAEEAPREHFTSTNTATDAYENFRSKLSFPAEIVMLHEEDPHGEEGDGEGEEQEQEGKHEHGEHDEHAEPAINVHTPMDKLCDIFQGGFKKQCLQDVELAAKEVIEGIRLNTPPPNENAEELEHEAEAEMNGEEAEEDFSDVDLSLALMLLGAIVWIMNLFNLVNDPDPDMRFYSWAVLSSTISIFVAVLCFQAAHTCLHSMLTRLGIVTGNSHFGISCFEMIVFWTTLQIVVARIAGVMEDNPFSRDRQSRNEAGAMGVMTLAAQVRARHAKMKCWATLLSHMSGFSSLTTGHMMFEFQFFRDYHWATFLIAPLIMSVQLILANLSRLIRQRVGDNQKAKGYSELSQPQGNDKEMREILVQGNTRPQEGMTKLPSDSESICEHCRKQIESDSLFCRHCSKPVSGKHVNTKLFDRAHGKAWALHMWQEETTEAENDVFALTGSFLLVRAITLCITHELEVESGAQVTTGSLVWICLAAIGFAGTTILAVGLQHNYFPGHEEEHDHDAANKAGKRLALGRRVGMVFQITMAMSLAWTALEFFKWVILKILPVLGGPEASAFRVVLSLIVSWVVLQLVRGLDYLADLEETGEDADVAIVMIINALGICVGFSWENSFHLAVEVVATEVGVQLLGQLVLAAIVAYTAIVPWRRHILGKVMLLDEERQRRKQKEEEAQSAAKPPAPAGTSSTSSLASTAVAGGKGGGKA